MNRILYIGLMLLALGACEEYFVPEIDPQEGVLVFEGLITNEMMAHTIKITESVPFNQARRPENISGFRVSIEDDQGYIIPLVEKSAGVYVTDDYVMGEVGRSYRMVASRNTGELYMSTFELLSPGVPIDTINGKATYKTILKYYEGAGYLSETTRGMTVLNDAVGKVGETYHRYEYDLVFQTSQYYPFVPFPYVAYIARPESSYNKNLISVLNCNLYSGMYAVNNPVDFIGESSMNVKVNLPHIEEDENGEPIFEPDEIRLSTFGFLINIKQHSLSENGYNFWSAIYSQSQSSGQLFDPVEAQVEGNMYDNNDSTQLVFGYFGASSVNIKGMHLKLRSNDRVEVSPIIYFPELTEPIDSNIPFDFWVR